MGSKGMAKNRERNVNVDLVRIFALLMVVSVHVFLYAGLYETVIDSLILSIGVYVRQFCMCCVPLFLLLTGYLQGGKEIVFGKPYVKKLSKVLVPYAIVTILLYCYFLLQGEVEANLATMLLGFENNGYTWYIEMYIGLYLLIPFINAGYRQLASKSSKQSLALVLCLICFVPTVVNSFEMLMMDYWFGLFPFAYYVLGMYLKEFPLNMKPAYKLAVLIISQMLNYALAFYEFRENLGNTLISYNNLFVAVNSVLVFHLLMDLDLRKMKRGTRTLIAMTADAVLPAFMFSTIVDKVLYQGYVLQYAETVERRLMMAPMTVIVVFVLSLLAGILICKLSTLVLSIGKHSKNV